MKIRATNDVLTIDETPGCLWIVGLFFVAVGGVFVYGALGGLRDWDAQPAVYIALAFVFGTVGIAAGVWIISRGPITHVVVDRTNRVVIWTRFGFMGRETDIYRLADVAGFCLIEDRDDEGAEIWWFGMELVTGEFLKIGSIASHFEENERRFVFAANEFAGIQPSATELALEGLPYEDH